MIEISNDVKLIIITFLINALTITVGLGYNSMVQSIINNYTPEDGRQCIMYNKIRYAIVLTVIFFVVLYLLYYFFPEIAKNSIKR